MRRTCLALTLAILLSGAELRAPAERGLPEKLWHELGAVAWGAPYKEWLGRHRQPVCREFHGTGAVLRADEEWCYRCVQQAESESTEWFFYALQPEEPPACRLEQFRASVTGLSGPELEGIRSDLLAHLDARYGPGVDPGRFLGEFGSASWQGTRRWQTGELEIYLYIDQYESPSLRLLARHRPLVDARAEEERLNKAEWGNWVIQSGGPVDAKIARELSGDYPELPRLLMEDPAYQDTPPSQHALEAALFRLLENAQSSLPERRPLLLLAADRLAAHLQFPEPKQPGEGRLRLNHARYELNFAWAPLGDVWVYRHDLLWRVSREAPDTVWGELAFLVLLEQGWDTSVGCQAGTDRFREVIRQGTNFLERHPNSPYRLDVVFALAESHETWWSLSHASPEDDYVNRASYEAGAAAAREKAIAYYEQVVQAAPTSDAAAYARRKLPRLKVGLDTNQRRFYCVYD